MKGLLHSKIFRKNLKKWLCMYVGALLLLTTVITYSKYISAFNSKPENARVTKFEVLVKSADDNCPACPEAAEGEEKIAEICCTTTNNYRPTTEINYNFIVEPTFEVNTLFITTITLDPQFNALKLVDNNGLELYDDSKVANYTTSVSADGTTTTITNKVIERVTDTENREITITRTTTKSNDNKTIKSDLISISKTITAKEISKELGINNNRTYSITVKCRYDEKYYNPQETEIPIIRVGYSARQVQ